MAQRAGTPLAATVTMPSLPAIVSPKVAAPYRAPQPLPEVSGVPGPETQQIMEEMEEDDLQ